ncbi:hypothetical protein AB751O23_AD_00290 [Chlamydiales bacterium SCGC AB-751-O23]|jgi:hypothetical protein|nr:hypothetical protein AB751O23_AD_00290 [Chlamydiales bacterium SCGC AB-751-O23]
MSIQFCTPLGKVYDSSYREIDRLQAMLSSDPNRSWQLHFNLCFIDQASSSSSNPILYHVKPSTDDELINIELDKENLASSFELELIGKVRSVDSIGKKIYLKDSLVVNYNHMVLCLGKTSTPKKEELIFGLITLSKALRIKESTAECLSFKDSSLNLQHTLLKKSHSQKLNCMFKSKSQINSSLFPHLNLGISKTLFHLVKI